MVVGQIIESIISKFGNLSIREALVVTSAYVRPPASTDSGGDGGESFLSSAANSVGTSLEFAAFGSGPHVKHSKASAFSFFSVHNHGFCDGPSTFSQEKTPVFIASVTRVIGA